MNHLTKSSYGQCRCRWCGHARPFGDCPITLDIRRALKAFAAAQGRNWKSALKSVWEQSCASISDMETRSLLQQARNSIGPRGLNRITPGMLRRIPDAQAS